MEGIEGMNTLAEFLAQPGYEQIFNQLAARPNHAAGHISEIQIWALRRISSPRTILAGRPGSVRGRPHAKPIADLNLRRRRQRGNPSMTGQPSALQLLHQAPAGRRAAQASKRMQHAMPQGHASFAAL